jgi:hypothetical protein
MEIHDADQSRQLVHMCKEIHDTPTKKESSVRMLVWRRLGSAFVGLWRIERGCSKDYLWATMGDALLSITPCLRLIFPQVH